MLFWRLLCCVVLCCVVLCCVVLCCVVLCCVVCVCSCFFVLLFQLCVFCCALVWVVVVFLVAVVVFLVLCVVVNFLSVLFADASRVMFSFLCAFSFGVLYRSVCFLPCGWFCFCVAFAFSVFWLKLRELSVLWPVCLCCLLLLSSVLSRVLSLGMSVDRSILLFADAYRVIHAFA